MTLARGRRRTVVVAITSAVVIAGLGFGASGASAEPVEPPPSTPVPTIGDEFAVLAEVGIVLEGLRLDTGAIGVRRSTAGPSGELDADLVVGAGTVVRDPAAVAVAGVVDTARGSRLGVVVHDSGTLRGRSAEQLSPASLPLRAVIPSVATPKVGTRDVVVADRRGLVPGRYRDVSVASGATLRLRGGDYAFASLTLETGALLRFEAASRVVVSGDVVVGDGATVLPVPGRGLTATDLLVATAAADAEPEDAPAIAVGSATRVRATLRAPLGRISVGASSILRGSMAARWVDVGLDVRMRFERPLVVGGEPTVTVTSPAPGAVLGEPTTLDATAVGGAAPYTVTWSVDDVTVETGDGADGTTTWDPRTAEPGAHLLRATIVDAHGRRATSTALPVTVVDTTSPGALLEQDHAAGLLSIDEYARATVLRHLDPDQVDARYRPSATDQVDLSTDLLPAFAVWDDLSPQTREEIRRAVVPQGFPEVTPPTEDVAPGASTPPADGSPPEEGHPPTEDVAPEASTPPTEDVAPEEGAPPTEDVAGEGYLPADDAPTSGDPLTGVEPGSAGDDSGAADERAPAGSPDVTDVPGQRAGPLPDPPLPTTPTTRGNLVCRSGLCTYATSAATFLFIWTGGTAGGVADVDVIDSDLELGVNGVPDVIDSAAEAFRQGVRVYEEDLGFARIAYQLVAVGPMPRGFALPNIWSSGFSTPRLEFSYIPGDRPVYSMQHELFHQYQYALGVPGGFVAGDTWGWSNRSVGWWLEATAEWATYQAQSRWEPNLHRVANDGDRDSYRSSVGAFLGTPHEALVRLAQDAGNTPQYGALVFAAYAEQRLGAGAIRETWRRAGRGQRPIDALRVIAVQQGSSLEELVDGFWDAYDVPRFGGLEGDWPTWLQGVDRPTHTTVRTTGAVSVKTVESALQPGGVVYVDMPQGTSHESVISVGMDVTGAERHVSGVHAELVHRSAENLGPYDGENCIVRGPVEVEFDDEGVALVDTTVYAGCSAPTLRITWPDARVGVRNQGAPTVAVRVHVISVPFHGTVDEDAGALMLHRVADAPEMNVVQPDGSFTFDVEYRFDPTLQVPLSACYWGNLPAGPLEVEINGAAHAVDADSRWTDPSGRFMMLYPMSGAVDHLTCLTLPAGAVVQGTNTLTVQSHRSLLVRAAHLTSYTYYEPEPDPEPCTEDCGPVAS